VSASHWSDQYIGIPYTPRGCARDGTDCWGLVRLVYSEILKIDLPDFDISYVTEADNARIADLVAEQKRVGEWVAINPDGVHEFDLLIIRWRALETHVAIVYGRSLMLHAMSGHDSHKARIGEWRGRVACAYRHWTRAS